MRFLERRLSLILVDTGLSLSQFRLLRLFTANTRLTVTEISARLSVTKASTTVLIQGLIKAGILATAPNPADSRSILVSLTAAGKRRLKITLKNLDKLEVSLGDSLPRNTIKALNRLILIDENNTRSLKEKHLQLINKQEGIQ